MQVTDEDVKKLLQTSLKTKKKTGKKKAPKKKDADNEVKEEGAADTEMKDAE